LSNNHTNLQLPNLYLIGLMGTGKSVAGELAAQKLGLQFIDSDNEIESKAGQDISAIFEKSGESAFREMEKDFISNGHPQFGCLVSCGGGLPVPEGMLETLKGRGMVVALWASPETIFERTKGNSARPLLQVPDPLGKITELLNARESAYLAADKVISTEQRSPKAVSELITRFYKENNGERGN
jgi:shikimate kinase